MNREARLNLMPALVAGAVIVGLMSIISIWAWNIIPADAKIPTHWGINGQPDSYGGKFDVLVVFPLIVLGEILLFILIPRIEPRNLNIARSATAYMAIWMVIIVSTALIYVTLVLFGIGRPIDVNAVVPAFIGVVLIVTGNYLGKLRSNFFIGIRTPWSLSSELSWNKTHRLGGKILMVVGFIMLLGLIIHNPAFFGALLTMGFVLLLAVTVLYSYFVWKSDPNKIDVGRSSEPVETTE